MTQTNDAGNSVPLEDVLLLSFRDNIDLGEDFGQFSVTYKQNCANSAWEYYKSNIQHQNNILDAKKTKKYNEGTLIFDDKGIKNASWRSINRLVDLLKEKYPNEKAFSLTKTEIESILPAEFIWRNENDIIKQMILI